MKSYIVKSEVYLKYEGDLEELANLLSTELQISEFWYKNDHDYPYNKVAYCEPLGFDVSLYKINENINYNYSLSLSTTCINVKMDVESECVDISQWLAQYISIVCRIDASAEK